MIERVRQDIVDVANPTGTVQILRKLGYRNLYNIEGGIENLWMKY